MGSKTQKEILFPNKTTIIYQLCDVFFFLNLYYYVVEPNINDQHRTTKDFLKSY